MAPLCPWGSSRQEYLSRLLVPSLGIFPTQGSNPYLPRCRQSLYYLRHHGSLLMAQRVKNLSAMQEAQVSHWIGKITWRRGWLPTPVFLPGEFHGQRKLTGYSPWGCKELDSTEWLSHTHTHTHTHEGCLYRKILVLMTSFHLKGII